MSGKGISFGLIWQVHENMAIDRKKYQLRLNLAIAWEIWQVAGKYGKWQEKVLVPFNFGKCQEICQVAGKE